MIVPISGRARKYGYFIWPSTADAELRALLGNAQTVQVFFAGTDIGTKNVDWKHRRISIGARRTGTLPAMAKSFILEFRNQMLAISISD